MKGALTIALLILGALCGGLAGYADCRGATPSAAGALEAGPADGGSRSDLAPTACSPASSDEESLAEERDTVAYALALNPDDPEALADAAELYLNRLPASRQRSEIGLLYARRGSERLEHHQQATSSAQKRAPSAKKRLGSTAPAAGSAEVGSLLARLALLEGQALLDLGRPQEALPRFEAAALKGQSDGQLQAEASYERGVARFELCQLTAARQDFTDWLGRYPKDKQVPWAHYQLGLTLEMLGEEPAAEAEIAEARRLEPTHFQAPLDVSPLEFRRLVESEVKALPSAAAADLKQVSLELSDLPALSDLTVEEPPLSPTIVGLFRGLALGQEPSEPRSIVLYRKNLLRSVRSQQSLRSEIRTTLLHELGHLRGADDDELRQRGLE